MSENRFAVFVVPAVFAAFAAAFYFSVQGLRPSSTIFPLLLIGGIGALVIGVVVTETVAMARGRVRTPAVSSAPAVGPVPAGAEPPPEPATPTLPGRSPRAAALTPVYAVALLALTIWAMPQIGYYPSSGGFVAALAYLLGVRNLRRLVLLVGCYLLGSFLVFDLALRINLP